MKGSQIWRNNLQGGEILSFFSLSSHVIWPECEPQSQSYADSWNSKKNLLFLAKGTRKGALEAWRVVREILERRELDKETNSVYELCKPQAQPRAVHVWS